MTTDAIVLLQSDHQRMRGLGRKRLQDMGAPMLERKKSAPRRPSQPSALRKAVDALIA